MTITVEYILSLKFTCAYISYTGLRQQKPDAQNFNSKETLKILKVLKLINSF